MNQLKIDLLFKNSHYKFSLEIAISPKPVMQQEKHTNKAFSESTWVLLKTDMESIILMFLLEFCLQIQLSFQWNYFIYWPGNDISTDILYTPISTFAWERNAIFQFVLFEKVCYCFSSPGPQEMCSVSWTWLQKPELSGFL